MTLVDVLVLAVFPIVPIILVIRYWMQAHFLKKFS